MKLYYPEVNSASVAGAVAGETIAYTGLNALEMTAALEAKVFFRGSDAGAGRRGPMQS